MAHLKLGGDPLLVLELDRGEKLTARLRLLSGDRDARLQPSDRDVHIRRLRGDRQLCCHGAGFGCLILRACRFPPSPQSAEHVDFPTRTDIGLVVAAAAVEVGRGVEHLSERRLNRLIGSGALRAHIGRWKQRCICQAQRRARLGDTCRRLRDVQILFEGQGDEAREQWIIEAGPPGLEIRLALNLPLRDAVLTEKAGRHGNLGRPVVRADRATRQEADTQQEGGRAGAGEHWKVR